MIKTAEINGILCRYYFTGKVYVSKDGTVAEDKHKRNVELNPGQVLHPGM